MAEAKKCDRCGQLYEIVTTPDLTINIYTHTYGDKIMDLCSECQGKFREVCKRNRHMKDSWIDFLAILVGIFAGICIIISYSQRGVII